MATIYQNHYSQNPSFYEDLFRDTEYWDSYLGILEQYKNEPTGTFWGTITGKNAQRRYDHYQNRDSALNALLEQMRSDEYNSTASQVMRDREAGLNPDLLGANGGVESSPISSQGQPLTPDDSFANVVNGAFTFISTVASAAVSIKSAMSQTLVNDGLRLQNIQTANNVALDALARTDISFDPNTEIMPSFSLGFNTGSRRLDRKLEKTAKSFLGSVPLETARRTLSKDLKKVRKETFDITSSAGYSDDDNFYAELAVRMSDMYLKLQELQVLSSSNELSERNEYLSSLDSTLLGESENATNLGVKNVENLVNEVRSLESGMLGFIKDEAKKGNQGAIEVLFRIFGKPISTPSFNKIGNDIGTGFDYFLNRGSYE